MFHHSFQKLYLRRLMRRKLFIQAAAFLENTRPSSTQLGYLYACLGMYSSVLNRPLLKPNTQDCFAHIIASAATGCLNQAEQLTVNWLKQRPTQALRKQLAHLLATYHPHLALHILQTIPHPPAPLLSSVLAAVDDKNTAKKILLSDTALSKYPEFHLLLENLSDKQNALHQCEAANRYLSSFGLEPIALSNPVLPFSTTNISSLSNSKIPNGPLVSILVTTYNNAARLPECIDSLLNQSYQNIEIIVVDDASTDQSEMIMRQFMQKDQRVQYIKLPKNIGTFSAKNIGISYARGEFVICHDSDDWAHPRKIEYQVRPLLSNSSLIFTISQWVRIDDNGLFYARQIFPLTRLNLSSLMFRKTIVQQKCGLWDNVRTGADCEFFERLKIVFGKKSYGYIKKPLTFGAHRENSLMTAADTGYDQHNVSPTRLAYWEAWRRWHIDCIKKSITPAMPNIMESRAFPAPQTLITPVSDYIYALNHHQHS